MKTINIGRAYSGGIFNGLFGNPVKEKVVSEQYRAHLIKVLENTPVQTDWLRKELADGGVLFCPGCGVGSPTCHARIVEQELAKL